jgi:hypothetical protein
MVDKTSPEFSLQFESGSTWHGVILSRAVRQAGRLQFGGGPRLLTGNGMLLMIYHFCNISCSSMTCLMIDDPGSCNFGRTSTRNSSSYSVSSQLELLLLFLGGMIYYQTDQDR